MHYLSTSPALFAAGIACFLLSHCAWAQSDPVDFNRDIRPLLSDRCFQCHGPDAEHREADLRFDQAVGQQSPFAERGDMPAITPGSPEKSSLWLRIISEDEYEVMPPPDAHKAALDAEEKEQIRQWILAGAPFDTHWSFKTPRSPEIPDVQKARWSSNRIDRLVHAALQAKGIQPKARADQRTLIRRLTLDLTGLPPTREEIEAFLNDPSPDAYEKRVDALLAEPAYGEHMARYWLDLVRFADTNGIHHDHYREMTPYRDWVIRSFNQNVPFDEFIRDQLAGDLLENPTIDQQVASGFNRLHLVIDRGTALPEESFHRNVVDRVAAFGTVFLGLTVECAQCHEHKYDPITQEEFYELYAFFDNIDAEPETPGGRQHPPLIRVPTLQQQAEIERQQAEIVDLEKKQSALQDQLKAAESEANSDAIEKAKAQLQALAALLEAGRKKRETLEQQAPTSLVMKERSEVRETRLRIRGAYDQLGPVVKRNTPDFLPPLKTAGEIPSRLDLAHWLTSDEHPLTARVAVNRIWQQFFGTGLVKTSEDFGAQGQPPSHPQLLDDLAIRFRESGWDVKRLVKEIVMSETYCQSSVASPEDYRRDRDNRLLARGSRFRLDAETIRDQILMVTGQLNREMYGRSVKPPQPPNLWKSVSMRSSNTYSFQADTGDKIVRRSVYSFWKRAMPPPQMTLFDAPTRESCTARRERTNTPLQALVLMNEEEYFRAAKLWARSVVQKYDDDSTRIQVLYESLTARIPDTGEAQALQDGLQSLRKNFEDNPQLAVELTESLALDDSESRTDIAAYATLINSLFNLDIFKTRN